QLPDPSHARACVANRKGCNIGMFHLFAPAREGFSVRASTDIAALVGFSVWIRTSGRSECCTSAEPMRLFLHLCQLSAYRGVPFVRLANVRLGLNVRWSNACLLALPPSLLVRSPPLERQVVGG